MAEEEEATESGDIFISWEKLEFLLIPPGSGSKRGAVQYKETTMHVPDRLSMPQVLGAPLADPAVSLPQIPEPSAGTG